jgi:hypothetical protein
VSNTIAKIEEEQHKVSKEVKWKVDDCQNLLKSRVLTQVKLVQTQITEKVIISHFQYYLDESKPL